MMAAARQAVSVTPREVKGDSDEDDGGSSWRASGAFQKAPREASSFVLEMDWPGAINMRVVDWQYGLRTFTILFIISVYSVFCIL